MKRRLLLGTAGAVALVLVFVAYRNPHFVVSLSNTIWSCF